MNPSHYQNGRCDFCGRHNVVYNAIVINSIVHWVLSVNLAAKVARLEQITAVLLAAMCFVFTAHVFTCSDDHRLSCWTSQQKSNEFGNTSLGRYWSMSLPETEKKGIRGKIKQISRGS